MEYFRWKDDVSVPYRNEICDNEAGNYTCEDLLSTFTNFCDYPLLFALPDDFRDCAQIRD